jgi:hypothetical protein
VGGGRPLDALKRCLAVLLLRYLFGSVLSIVKVDVIGANGLDHLGYFPPIACSAHDLL